MTQEKKSRCKPKNPKKIKQIVTEKLKSVKKEVLNVIAAHDKWSIYQGNNDAKKKSPITTTDLEKVNFDTKFDWFSSPENTSSGLLLRFLDHHHLLTNCRIHCCKNGFKRMNIKSTAWLKVAKDNRDNKSGLNIAYVEDLVDAQSNDIAQITFSREVEDVMRRNKDINEANFCKMIREWYEAVDEKGIPAKDRVIKLLTLREYLLESSHRDLITFPPPGTHISSMPIGLFTGLLISCERLIQLYRISKTGNYNVRAVGSLDNETFFSCFRDLDPRGAGVLKTSEIPRAMSISCDVLTTRMNPKRGFYFKTTSRLPVYNEDPYEIMETEHNATEPSDANDGFKDHHLFDMPRTTAKKRKYGAINSYSSCPRGAQGIRQYHRKDEEKILPHKRANIDI